MWHGWAPSVYLADLEKAGVELKDKVKDSRRVEDLDREVREWAVLQIATIETYNGMRSHKKKRIVEAVKNALRDG